jgi:hypothetical protein
MLKDEIKKNQLKKHKKNLGQPVRLTCQIYDLGYDTRITSQKSN